MYRVGKHWIAMALLSGYALTAFGVGFNMASEAATSTDERSDSFQDWTAVDSTVLDSMRGGFDIAPGLKVSFGIERIVNLNGVLQTATRIEVPDAAKLMQAQQPGGKPGETISLPVTANLGGGASALVQNGAGNVTTLGALSPDAAATIIQNSANNQTIQSVTVVNAATNSLELLKGANLHSTLLEALTQSARNH
jgi:hypothetical protein